MRKHTNGVDAGAPGMPHPPKCLKMAAAENLCDAQNNAAVGCPDTLDNAAVVIWPLLIMQPPSPNQHHPLHLARLPCSVLLHNVEFNFSAGS